MQHQTRTLAVLLIALVVAAGCARVGDQRVGQPLSFPASGPFVYAPATPPPAPAVVVAPAPTPVAVVTPIPGHPPVDTTGVVKSYDASTRTITFADGRIMKLTDGSRVLKPSEVATVRPGDAVIVRNVLPVAVQTGTATWVGKRQKIGTIAAIDQQNQIVLLTDRTAVRISPAATMKMGSAGQTVMLTELRPGDELVIVLKDPAPRAGDATAAGSALPREVTTAVVDDADGVMIFRTVPVR
jgi:hypothetical protein